MNRRTNEQIKQTLKAEYGAMYEAGCETLIIARAIGDRYSPRLIIEAIQEYNNERIKNRTEKNTRTSHNNLQTA